MSKNNFYESVTSSDLLFSGSTSGTEPNIRQELIDMFNGTYPEIPKATKGLLRRMRLDSSGNRIQCGCVDSITKEPDKDRFCPICYGEGYLWDEVLLDYYRMLTDSDRSNTIQARLIQPGLINIPLVVFYIRYDSNITNKDKIVQLKLNTDGSIYTPYKRECLYRIETAWDLRSDNGKLEYWKIFTHKEDVKYLNAPKYGDV